MSQFSSKRLTFSLDFSGIKTEATRPRIIEWKDSPRARKDRSFVDGAVSETAPVMESLANQSN